MKKRLVITMLFGLLLSSTALAQNGNTWTAPILGEKKSLMDYYAGSTQCTRQEKFLHSRERTGIDQRRKSDARSARDLVVRRR